jgi:hypothetical protein
MATREQYKLFEALKAHTSELEAERYGAAALDQAVLNRRLEATRGLLEWLSGALDSRESHSTHRSNAVALKYCSRNGSRSDRHIR